MITDAAARLEPAVPDATTGPLGRQLCTYGIPATRVRQ
jgi:hypothetical protein